MGTRPGHRPRSSTPLPPTLRTPTCKMPVLLQSPNFRTRKGAACSGGWRSPSLP
jgi:hypothetical protein